MTDPERELLELGRRALSPAPERRDALRARIDRAIAAGPPAGPRNWPGLLGLAALVVAGVVLWSSRTPEVSGPRESTEVDAPHLVVDATDAGLASSVDTGPLESDAAISESAARERPRSRPPSADTLDRELQILGVARRALARGDGLASLVALAEHARSFPDGALAEERDALFVRAHCAAGHERDAREGLVRFTERYPSSVSLPTLRASCAGPVSSP